MLAGRRAEFWGGRVWERSKGITGGGECQTWGWDVGLRWWNLPSGEGRILLLEKGRRKLGAGEAGRLVDLEVELFQAFPLISKIPILARGRYMLGE